MSNRDRRYNASLKGKARKRRYRKSHRSAVLAYGRRYYRGVRLRKLRASLGGARTTEERQQVRSEIARLLALIRKEKGSR